MITAKYLSSEMDVLAAVATPWWARRLSCVLERPTDCSFWRAIDNMLASCLNLMPPSALTFQITTGSSLRRGRGTLTRRCHFDEKATSERSPRHLSYPQITHLTRHSLPLLPLGVAPARSARFNTALRRAISESDKTSENKEIDAISDKWAEVRLLSREEAESTLEPEWLEAYNRFYQKYDDDIVQMTELAEKVAKALAPPKVQKKTEGQKKRDAFAKKQAREEARAAATAAASK